MFTIMINPENYKYLYYACKHYEAEMFPPQDNGSDYIFCPVRCTPEQLFHIGRMFERMKIESENFNDKEEKDCE